MQGIHKLDRFPHVSMLLLLKNVCIGRRRSAKKTVWQFTQFLLPGKEVRKDRIGHPDWAKLCVELNCVPNENMKFASTTQVLLCITDDLIKHQSFVDIVK